MAVLKMAILFDYGNRAVILLSKAERFLDSLSFPLYLFCRSPSPIGDPHDNSDHHKNPTERHFLKAQLPTQ